MGRQCQPARTSAALSSSRPLGKSGWDDSEHRRRCWEIDNHQPQLPSCDTSFRALCRLVTQKQALVFIPSDSSLAHAGWRRYCIASTGNDQGLFPSGRRPTAREDRSHGLPGIYQKQPGRQWSSASAGPPRRALILKGFGTLRLALRSFGRVLW